MDTGGEPAPDAIAAVLYPLLHSTRPWPDEFTYIRLTVMLIGVALYGSMIPLLAAKKFAKSVSVTTAAWDVKSETARAMVVTLRLVAIAPVNSTVPKNSTSKIGAMKENSIAATPRRSFNSRTASRCVRRQIFADDPIAEIMTRRLRCKARYERRRLPSEAADCRSDWKD